MQHWIRNTIANLALLLPLNWLRQKEGMPIFLPFYHIVAEKQPDYINSYVVRTKAEFLKEIDFLLKYYKPVSLREIIESPASNKMHLTFDDGLVECATVIAPILKEKGIPATFFVSPEFVDNSSLFHRFKRSILQENGLLAKDGKKYFLHETELLETIENESFVSFSDYRPYMSLDQIKDLQNHGFTIGAHSMNHPEMDLLSEEQQYVQIEESMQWIVDHFNPEIKAFSFPFTDNGVRQSLFNRLKENGIVDVSFGTAGLKYDSAQYHYQRVPVELVYNWSIKKVVHFEYFYFKIRNLFSANTVKR